MDRRFAPTRRRFAHPLIAVLVLFAAMLAVSACGYSSDSLEVVEGEPVELGDLHYNVVFSRFLNPNDNEDSAYLVGQEAAPPGTSYFGVFFEIKNDTDHAQELPDSLTIRDAEHEVFEVVPSESLYALPLGGEVESEEQIPVLDSTAQQGPIEGALAIFLLPDYVSENRPLILEIPGSDGDAEVTLDL